MYSIVAFILVVLYVIVFIGIIKPELFKDAKTGKVYTRKQFVLAFGALLVLSVVVRAAFGPKIESPAVMDTSTPEVTKDDRFPHAKPYKIVTTDDFDFAGRKRVGVYIVSPAATFDERAHTAMKAAVEYQGKTDADYVKAILEPSAILAANGTPLAIAEYAPDSGGLNGRQGWKWSVKSSADKIDPDRLKAAELWKQNRERFKRDGLVDEGALKKFIAEKLSIPVERVLPIFIHFEPYEM